MSRRNYTIPPGQGFRPSPSHSPRSNPQDPYSPPPTGRGGSTYGAGSSARSADSPSPGGKVVSPWIAGLFVEGGDGVESNRVPLCARLDIRRPVGPRLVSDNFGQIRYFSNTAQGTVVTAAFSSRLVQEVVADLLRAAHDRHGRPTVKKAVARLTQQAPEGSIPELFVRVFARSAVRSPVAVMVDPIVPTGLVVVTPNTGEVGSIWQLCNRVALVVYDIDRFVVASA